MIKKFFVVILVILILITFYNYGMNVYGVDSGEEIEKLTNATAEDNNKLLTTAQKLGGTFLTIFKVVGVGIALIMLIVLAMKYMLAAPGDKADIKKHAVIYIVGAICLFGASGIMQIIGNLSKNLGE